MSRTITLFRFFGDEIIDIHYRGRVELISCGICGNEVPEKLYLDNDCPHCFGGVDDEVADENFEKRFWKNVNLDDLL